MSLALASSIPVLGLEKFCPRKGCPWPRIFFVSLALASSLVSSTPPLMLAAITVGANFMSASIFPLKSSILVSNARKQSQLIFLCCSSMHQKLLVERKVRFCKWIDVPSQKRIGRFAQNHKEIPQFSKLCFPAKYRFCTVILVDCVICRR